MDLRSRWVALTERLNARRDTLPIFQREIEARYGEPHRAYHTLAHLEHCMAELDAVRTRLGDEGAVELALWFHDAVYNVHFPGDNETKSAELAELVAADLGLAQERIVKIRQWILATKTHDLDAAGEPDGALMLDIDMSVLGQSAPVYDAYTTNVRREFSWVPAFVYTKKRGDFLRALLARERIFMSDFFRARYEAAARANIARELAA